MQKNISLHSLIFCLLALIPAIILGVSVRYLSDDPQSPLNYLSYLFLIGALVYGQIHWRNNGRDGFMTYGQAFKYVLLFSTWYAILMTIWTFIFFSVIAPEMVDMILEQSRQQMEAQGMPEDQIEVAIEMTRTFTSPLMMSVFSLIGGFITGLILGLITSAFTKKDKPFQPIG